MAMKTVLYRDLEVSDSIKQLAVDKVKAIRHQLITKYSGGSEQDYEACRHVNLLERAFEPFYHSQWGGKGATIDYWISRMLARVLQVSNGQINGKTIMDIGSGSVLDEETDYSGDTADITGSPSNHGSVSIWNPWLCRALHELGGYPIALDFGSLRNEPYQTFEHIDIMREELPLDQGTVDVAHSHAFVGSFQMSKLHEDPRGKFEENVIPQLEKIIKKEGIFVYDNSLTPV